MEFRMFEPHTEIVNDTAKLIIGRMISRELGKHPELIDEASERLEVMAERNGETDYVQIWRDLLRRDTPSIQRVLRGRDEMSTWLRLTIPFSPTSANIPLHDTEFRRRIWRDARRLVMMGLGSERANGYDVSEQSDGANIRRFG
jgi:hypothetical protein